MATTLVDSVIHWRKKLERSNDEDIILNVIHKLSKVPITLEILEVTHIGKRIRNLSKKEGIVGEKALAVLKKWRDTFANAGKPTNPNSKPPNISKKENINRDSKSSSKHDVSNKKAVSHQKESHHEYKNKHEKCAVSRSSAQSSKKHANGHYHSNNSINSSPLAYTYEKNDIEPKYMDYDPNANVDEGYNPDYPEIFPGDKSLETKKPDVVNSHGPKSSEKYKLKCEKQTEPLSKPKKQNQFSFDSLNAFESKSVEQKEKHNIHKEKYKEHKSHSNSKESSASSSKATDVSKEKHKSSVSKKSKNKEYNENNIKCSESKSKMKLNCSEEFTSSEVRFEDCLGFNDIVPLKKKKTSKSQSVAKKTVNNSKPISSPPSQKIKAKRRIIEDSTDSCKEKLHIDIPKPFVKLDVVDIVSTLPEIQPNYRPLPRSIDFLSPKKKEVLTNEDAIRFTSSRREKTAVYSGRKSYFSEVPSLFECCSRVLIENIDAIEYLGELPYFLLKPVLERCTPSQLFTIENFNPNLLESTNELWEVHCKRDYKLLLPQESETWRDLYLRAHDEREKKLKSVTANISASMSKSNPVRQVKMAFVDSIAKPPRDVARRQAKNGTARPVNTVVKAGPPSKATPRPPAPQMSSGAASSSASFSFVPKKPKVAPLMAKTLKSMKQCFRR